MPVMSMAVAMERRQMIVTAIEKLLNEGIDGDYGVIPGTTKKTLLQPGAQKLDNLFGLVPKFFIQEKDLDWTGARHNGEPFFYFEVCCKLFRGEFFMGEGVGSCNSWESKYRYRNSERVCPECGRDAIIRGKAEYGGGWLCFKRKGGCGVKFEAGDPAIEGQETGKKPNPDIADVVNTVMKIANKRAHVAATINATSASEFFAQDLEDMPSYGAPAAPPASPVDGGKGQPAAASSPAAPPRRPSAQPTQEAPAKPWQTFRGMLEAFAELHGRLTPQHDHVYSEVLAEFGVQHSNQFKQTGRAIDAYYRLLQRVREIEAADEAAMSDVAELREEIRPPEEEASL
jgi:hypothetical protein